MLEVLPAESTRSSPSCIPSSRRSTGDGRAKMPPPACVIVRRERDVVHFRIGPDVPPSGPSIIMRAQGVDS